MLLLRVELIDGLQRYLIGSAGVRLLFRVDKPVLFWVYKGLGVTRQSAARIYSDQILLPIESSRM